MLSKSSDEETVFSHAARNRTSCWDLRSLHARIGGCFFEAANGIQTTRRATGRLLTERSTKAHHVIRIVRDSDLFLARGDTVPEQNRNSNHEYVCRPRRFTREFTGIRGISLAIVVTLNNLSMPPRRSSLMAALLLLIAACATKGLPPSNVATLLNHQPAVNGITSRFTCTGPQRDWDYICEVQHFPRPGSSSSNPISQRVGLTLMMRSCNSPQCRPEFRGKPVFSESVLPSDGPVPSKAELSRLGKAQAAQPTQRRRSVTVPSTAKQPVPAKPNVDLQAVAAGLLSADRQERNSAFHVASRLPPESVEPALRRALFAYLDRLNLDREHARQAGIPLRTVEDPEFVASVHRTVAALNDPEAIPALARALGMSTVIRALLKFGEQAAPAVLTVVGSPQTHYSAVNDGLRVLDWMVTGGGPDENTRSPAPLSAGTLDRVKQVVTERLTGRQYFTTLWYAVDLADSLEGDAELMSALEVLATDPTAVLLPVDDPKLIERTRGGAAAVLARMRARSP